MFEVNVSDVGAWLIIDNRRVVVPIVPAIIYSWERNSHMSRTFRLTISFAKNTDLSGEVQWLGGIG